MSIFFHNGSNYDYHLIIKEVVEEFEGQFTCLGENTEEYITYSVPIEKQNAKIDEKEKEITKTISYILQFIDRAKFMASSLSDLVSNLADIIHKIECKYGHEDKKCEIYEIKYNEMQLLY